MKFINFIKDSFTNFQRSSTSPFEYSPYNYFFLILIVFFSGIIYLVAFKHFNVTIHTLNLAYLFFFLGKTFELRRISGNWIEVIKCMGTAFLISLLILVAKPKNGNLRFQDNLDFWPIAFSIIFLILGAQLYSSKVTIKLSEGTTLLHSLALLYLLSELVFKSGLHFIFIIIFLPFIFYSLFHALTFKEISRKDRLYLSLWNSFIMAIFAGMYIFNVFQMKNIENLIFENNYLEASNLMLDCFFLGASGAYILQNIFMLISYSPEKNNLSSSDYKNKVERLNELHIERYSAKQVDRKEAAFVFIFLVTIFTINFFIEVITPSMTIWICFIVVPLLVSVFIHLWNKLINDEQKESS